MQRAQIHVAAPFPLCETGAAAERAERALLEGTLNVLKACAALPSLKMLVVVSCAAAATAADTAGAVDENEGKREKKGLKKW